LSLSFIIECKYIKILSDKGEKSNLQNNLIKDQTQVGIWQYHRYLPEVPLEFRLSLNEGNTSEQELDPEIFLKREDQNPTGSLKDRGMAFLISKASSLGFKQFVLSSSGNAAISAANYCAKANLKLKVFVSVRVNKGKLKKLEQMKVDLSVDQRPLTMATRFAKENNFYNLRPSINEFGSTGYQTIAFELLENQDRIENLFVPVSSGVNFLGISKGFKKFGYVPKLHLCQSSFIFPLASIFDHNFVQEDSSFASALVARQSPLKKEILQAVADSKGTGWVVDNKQTIQADKILKQKGISTSFEGALTYAAVLKARQNDQLKGRTVCLLTGKNYSNDTT